MILHAEYLRITGKKLAFDKWEKFFTLSSIILENLMVKGSKYCLKILDYLMYLNKYKNLRLHVK